MIRDTDPVRFVHRMQVAIDAGNKVIRTYTYLEWRRWRYVVVYACVLEAEPPKSKLLLTFGPVRDQPLPGPNEDCDDGKF